MKEYNYYWYHHMSMPSDVRKEINDCIVNHEYEKFIAYYKKWNSYGVLNGRIDTSYEFSKGRLFYPLVYFPEGMNDPDTDEYLSILDEENFNKITHSECECG